MNEFATHAYSDNDLFPDQLKEKIKEKQGQDLNLLKTYLETKEMQKITTAAQVIDNLCTEDLSKKRQVEIMFRKIYCALANFLTKFYWKINSGLGSKDLSHSCLSSGIRWSLEINI